MNYIWNKLGLGSNISANQGSSSSEEEKKVSSNSCGSVEQSNAKSKARASSTGSQSSEKSESSEKSINSRKKEKGKQKMNLDPNFTIISKEELRNLRRMKQQFEEIKEQQRSKLKLKEKGVKYFPSSSNNNNNNTSQVVIQSNNNQSGLLSKEEVIVQVQDRSFCKEFFVNDSRYTLKFKLEVAMHILDPSKRFIEARIPNSLVGALFVLLSKQTSINEINNCQRLKCYLKSIFKAQILFMDEEYGRYKRECCNLGIGSFSLCMSSAYDPIYREAAREIKIR